MTGVGDQLLRALGSGVRGPGPASTQPKASDPKVAFEELLRQARAGEIETGAPVSVARGAGVELSADQLARLSAAADKLEAAGATRALVLMDGRALVLDVATRTVAGVMPMDPGRPVVGVDAVLRLSDAPASAPSAPIVGTPRAEPAGLNPSLARALSGNAA